MRTKTPSFSRAIRGGGRAEACTNCNRGLGKFGDDVELLRRALSYLETTIV